MMSQKTVILTVVLFAIIVLGMFIYAHLRQSEIGAYESRHGIYS